MSTPAHPAMYVLKAFLRHVDQEAGDGLVGCRDPHCRPFYTGEDPPEVGRYVCPCGVSLKNSRQFRKHLREQHAARKVSPYTARRFRRPGEVKARR